VEVGLGDLDVVPEIIREPDLQAADSGAFLLGAFQLGQPGFVAACQRAHPIQFGVISRADEISVVEIGGQLIRQGGGEHFAQWRQFDDALEIFGRERAAETRQGGAHGRQLSERVANSTEFPRTPQPVLEATENARDIAHLRQQIAQGSEMGGLRAQYADSLLPAVNFREFERGRREPAFEQAHARCRDRAIDRAEQGALACPTAGREDLEVAQGGRVEQQRARAAVFLEAAQVFGFGAEIFRRVVNQCAGRTQGRMGVRETEPLEVQHPKGIHDGLGSCGAFEVITRQLRAEPAGAKAMQRVHRRLVVGQGLPARQFALGDQQLRRIERRQHGQEIFHPRIGADLEFARREIEPRHMQAVFVQGHGAEIMIARRIELIGREGRARAENSRELAPDEFAGFRRLRLVANGNFLTGRQQFGDIVVGRVKRNSGHRGFLALGQGETEQARRGDGVIEKHLVEIAQAEEQDGLARQPAFDLEVLLHHGRELRF